MSDNSLPRAERLRSMKSIRHLFESGRSGFVYPLRYIYLVAEIGREAEVKSEAEAEAGAEVLTKAEAEVKAGAEVLKNVKAEALRPVEVMFSVPKRFHKRANRRNLHKRRMREAYRLGRGELCERLHEQHKHLQLALVYSTKESHSYKTVKYALQRIFEQISATL